MNYFSLYAESVPDGDTSLQLSSIARSLKIFLIGGSIPEKKDGKLFNTSTVWGPQGNLLATHRKIHLFDVDLPGVITFKESDALTPGKQLTTFEIRDFKIGFGICFDVRFEELAKLYRKRGCNVLVYPGAFDMKLGQMQWELMARARANDNQCYAALVSVARDVKADYVSWGHSMIVDPWGQVLESAEADEKIITADIRKYFA